MCKNCAFYVKTRSCCHFAILLPYRNLLCINNFCKMAAIAAKNKNLGSIGFGTKLPIVWPRWGQTVYSCLKQSVKICVICGQKNQEFLPRSVQSIALYHKDHSSVRYEAMLYRGIELCFRTSKALLCKRQSIELRPQKHCSKGCEAMFMKRQNKAPYAMKQCCLIERTVLLKRRQ